MRAMNVIVSALAVLSLMLELGVRWWLEEPWIGKLHFFIFMAEGNIEPKDISSHPTSLTFFTVTLVMLITAIIILKITKQRVNR